MSDVTTKVATAKEKKQLGDEAFKEGRIQDALKAYHEALLFLHGLDRNALKMLTGGERQEIDPGTGKVKEEKTEVDEIVEKVYSNMSACHIKQGNWKRALETADQALAKNDKNYKAIFRKGKALGELGYFEKAEKVLEELAKNSADDAPTVNRELERLRAIDAQREKENREKMKGFLSKGVKKSIGKDTVSTSDANASASPPPSQVETETEKNN